MVRKVRRQYLRTPVRPVSQKGHLTTGYHKTSALLKPEAEGDQPFFSQARQGADDFNEG
jgi:hypothetical protein